MATVTMARGLDHAGCVIVGTHTHNLGTVRNERGVGAPQSSGRAMQRPFVSNMPHKASWSYSVGCQEQ